MPRLLCGSLGVVVVLVLAGCSDNASERKSAPDQRAPVPTVLILDASDSMNTADAPGPRIDAAKAAAKGLVTALPDNTQLALVSYGTSTGNSEDEQAAGCQDVKTLVPLGRLDRGVMNAQIDGLQARGYTPISLALTKAAALLPQDDSQQAIVLVSDGEDTCGQPPCDVATQLRQQHPGLSISTVGFRTEGPASEQLNCIATSTGGLFVQAANASQLAARLLATQNVSAARESLTSTGFSGVDIGATAEDIRNAHPDFPNVAGSGRVVVAWRDCDFTFVDGKLDSIAPHGGGRTIDGVAAGSQVTDAVKFYGDPVGDASREGALDWLVFVADKALNTAYRIGIEGYSASGAGISGTIRQIVLCRCLPHAAPSGPPVASFDGYGALKIGMTEADAVAAMGPSSKNHYYSCTVYGVNAMDTLKVWIKDSSGRVTGIDTPPGTMTDRGVGDRSSPTEIRSAYPGYTIDEGNNGGQGMPAIIVYDGEKSYDNPRKISFGLRDDGTAYAPSVGRSMASEGC